VTSRRVIANSKNIRRHGVAFKAMRKPGLEFCCGGATSGRSRPRDAVH